MSLYVYLLMTSLDETISAVTKFFAEGMGESGRVTYPKTLVDTVILLIFLYIIKAIKGRYRNRKTLDKPKVTVLISSSWFLTMLVIGVLNYVECTLETRDCELLLDGYDDCLYGLFSTYVGINIFL